MKIYKVIIDERISHTAYILADSKKQAGEKAISRDIDYYSNQDFEQKILSVQRIEKDELKFNEVINE